MPCALLTPKTRQKQISFLQLGSIWGNSSFSLSWIHHGALSSCMPRMPLLRFASIFASFASMIFRGMLPLLLSKAEDRVDFNLKQLARLTKQPDSPLCCISIDDPTAEGCRSGISPFLCQKLEISLCRNIMTAWTSLNMSRTKMTWTHLITLIIQRPNGWGKIRIQLYGYNDAHMCFIYFILSYQITHIYNCIYVCIRIQSHSNIEIYVYIYNIIYYKSIPYFTVMWISEWKPKFGLQGLRADGMPIAGPPRPSALRSFWRPGEGSTRPRCNWKPHHMISLPVAYKSIHHHYIYMIVYVYI